MTADLDRTALRAVAEAATRREWMSASDNKRKDGIALVGIAELRGQGGRGCIAVLAGSGDAIKDRHANAAHIATFDPPTILALLDETDRLAAEVARLGAQVAAVEALADEWAASNLGYPESPSVFISELRAALAHCRHCNHGPGFTHEVGCDAGCV